MRIISMNTVLSVGILSLVMSGCIDLSQIKLPQLPSLPSLPSHNSSQAQEQSTNPLLNYPGFDKRWIPSKMTYEQCQAYYKFKRNYTDKLSKIYMDHPHSEAGQEAGRKLEDFMFMTEVQILDTACQDVGNKKLNEY